MAAIAVLASKLVPLVKPDFFIQKHLAHQTFWTHLWITIVIRFCNFCHQHLNNSHVGYFLRFWPYNLWKKLWQPCCDCSLICCSVHCCRK